MEGVQIWDMVLPDGSEEFECMGHPVSDSIDNKARIKINIASDEYYFNPRGKNGRLIDQGPFYNHFSLYKCDVRKPRHFSTNC